MAHPNARLSVFGRQLLVGRMAQGWPASEAARQRRQPRHHLQVAAPLPLQGRGRIAGPAQPPTPLTTPPGG